MRPDPTERDDEREPDAERAERERRATPVPDEGRPRESLLEPEREPERQAAEAREHRHEQRDREGHHEQDPVHDERPDRGAATGAGRPDDEADGRDDEEDDHQPAQTRATRGRQIEPRAERLHRRDACRAIGGLQCRGDRDDEPDRDRQRGTLDRERW